ncbi:hypothetical protein P12x_002569 [Tundrisphaera lichenicola]|uniref:hypothetical protein n=1 Tax=Tundrisphaera lichenicola TaxID=2029860 RepID=UPI003EB8E71E
MPRARKDRGLELDEDIPFQEKTWAWQRVAWSIMAAILLLGLIGLFGDGPISKASVGDGGGSLRVEYRRFARRQAETILEFIVPPGPGKEVRIWVDREYADRADIRRVEPDPARVEVGSDGITYVMPVVRSDRPVRIQLHAYPEDPGPLRGQVRAGDGPKLGFTHFIYP